MAIHAIISYDGTNQDDDALALGRLLAGAGVRLSLAYVRHTREYDPAREQVSAYDAARRLEAGAAWLGMEQIERHVVFNPSTSAGLAALAGAQRASLILFGSDYRTPPGHVEPGGSAQGLLEGSTVAVGVAQSGLRSRPSPALTTVSVAGAPGGAADRTAAALAPALGARLIAGGADADLILVDSQANAPDGRIALGGSTRARLDSARGSVIVLARGTPLAL